MFSEGIAVAMACAARRGTAKVENFMLKVWCSDCGVEDSARGLKARERKESEEGEHCGSSKVERSLATLVRGKHFAVRTHDAVHFPEKQFLANDAIAQHRAKISAASAENALPESGRPRGRLWLR